MYNNKQAIISKKSDFLWMTLTVVSSLAIVFFVYRLWEREITCPIVYYGDGVGGLLSIKNIVNGNGFFNFPSLRAPYGEYNYNQDYILPLMIISIFSIFTKSVGALSNMFWLFTYVLTACTTYAFLRKVRCTPIIASLGAIIYNFLPYHYFRLEHFWLFGCYIIPLIGWIVIDILEGNILDNSTKIKIGKKYFNQKLLIDLIFSILIGLNGLYYSYFAVLLFVFSGIIAAIEKKKVKNLLLVFLYSVIIFAIILYFMVILGYVHDGGKALSNIASTRGVGDVHTYSLDMFLMFLPIPGHRISMFNEFTHYCYNTFGIRTENYEAALGLIMSIGLIISIFFAFLSKRKNQEFIAIRQFGILNLFIIIVASIGGLGTFVSIFISSAIRCYNRISVIIALFSIATVCLTVNYLFNKYRTRFATELFITVIIVFIGIYDQTSPMFAEYTSYDALSHEYSGPRAEADLRYKEDMEYVKNIELILGAGKNIYILPNEGQYSQDRVPFAKTKGYICGKVSNWSTSILDTQYKNSLSLIEGGDFNSFIKNISLLGFSGVIIDKNSFDTDEPYFEMIEKFIYLLNLSPYYNITGDLCFFDISDVALSICSNYTTEYIEAVRLYFANDVTTNKFVLMDLNTFYGNDISINNHIEMNTDSILYSPMIKLDKGYYQVTILGNHLDNGQIKLIIDNKEFELSNIDFSKDTISFEFYLDSIRENVVFAMLSKNNSIINNIVMQISQNGSFESYQKYTDNLEIRKELFGTVQIPLSNFYVGGSAQKDDGFIIPQNTMQYGPYIRIEPGKYKVTISGINLQNAELQLVKNGGKETIEMLNIEKNYSSISFEFTSYISVPNLEIYLSCTDGDMQIKQYTLEILN